MTSLTLSSAHRTTAPTFRPLEHFRYPARRRDFLGARAVQSFPDTSKLLFRITRVAPGKHGVDRGALQILMLPAKLVNGRVPREDVSSEVLQRRIHAVAPRFLSKALSRFCRSVSRAVSFSWSCTQAKVCVPNCRWTRVSRLVML